MMGIHKLTAGDGYLYLIRQTAAADSDKGRSSLGDYYSAKGESPGRWIGRGLSSLAAPASRNLAADIEQDMWSVGEGSQVTEDQMKALFGLGLHPNAAAIVRHLVTVNGLAQQPAIDAATLGRPFAINDGDTALQKRLAVAYRDHNLSSGRRWNDPIADDERAAMRTAVAREMFEEHYGRAPLNPRELSGFIARATRQLTTSVAGYDLTFTPVKSVSALWAIAPVEVSRRIEAAHDRAVADTLEYLQTHAAFTRTGAGGVAQLDTDGFIAALFTHRDNRAGDPGLHTHVAVSNKVRATGADGIPRWLALDGRALFKNTVAASELYNTALEGHLGDTLGVRFADRGGEGRGKRPVREIVGVPTDLIHLWSSRRAAIDQRYTELAKRFQAAHGREPTTVEAIALTQQATLETRQAKHEPRSLAEQRQVWRTQAVELLGSPQALAGLLGHVMSGRRRIPETVTPDWIDRQAGRVVATVSETRAVWQRTHVYAEAQRLVRAAGHAADPSLAQRITDAALREPYSIAVGADRDADLGEPAQLRRSDGTSVFSTHQSQQFTSAALVAAERRILAAARRRDGRRADPAEVDLALATQAALGRELNVGQQELVREMTTSGARVALALAPAGTGKTTAMTTLARAWRDSGGTVVGLAPSAAAAEVLRQEIGVTATDTTAKYAWLQHNPVDDGDPARVWFDRVGPTTLLIVDEAGKAGTLELDSVIGHALARGASVRLIGDDQQLASISAGGVLRDIRREQGARTLYEVVRFADRSEAQATKALRDGDPAALAFLIDHGRVHVGADATAADLAYAGWRADRAAGRDALLLAPTHELVAGLNERARLDRLTAAGTDGAAAEVTLADGLRASAGDIVCTRSNDRRLRISTTDYVRNGYRWQVEKVNGAGGLGVRHLESGRRVALPAGYVAEHVTLGYAATIDSVQGVTAGDRRRGVAGTCHLVGGDHLTRQQLYVAMTRGTDENHIYLSTAETDPHRVLTPKATHPDTAVDVLTRVLARNAEQLSATTAEQLARDPSARLQHAAAAYSHAVGEAAVAQLGPARVARIDAGAEAALPGLTAATAWPVLRGHLAVLAIGGDDALAGLTAAIGESDLTGAADVAAVLDWRLDHGGTQAGGGPLRWQPAIPATLAAQPQWACLQRRHDRVAALADAVRRTAASWTHRDAPGWARPLLTANRGLLAEIAVFRAATGVPEEDSRIAGPAQDAVRTRAVQALLERQAAAAIGRRDADTGRWNSVLDGIDPHIRRDTYYPQLAAHLDIVARTGVDLRQLLSDAAGRGPLPDELPAAALWWRLAGTLAPATLEAADSGLRPAWTPDLHHVFGTRLAEAITADPAWPGLVAAVAAADPRRWTPRELLTVAAEHLRDADPDGLLRPDEYARLITYSIDLFTTGHPFAPDIPPPAEPPLTPEQDEELRHRHPDPDRPDVEADALLDDFAFSVDTRYAAANEPFEPDPLGTGHDDLGGLDFDDLPAQRPAAPLLQPVLDDVRALRAQQQQARDRLAQLQVGVDEFNGPAVRAAAPRLQRLRRRAAADRPYRRRIEEIFALWADAEQQYTDMQHQTRWAQSEAERLRAEGADELDVRSAEAHTRFLRQHLPPAPARRFHDELTAAVAARAEAAGGAERIVTAEDVDKVMAQAVHTDAQALRDARIRLRRLGERLAASEAAAAAAFAAAETRSADHVADQIDALRTELAVLEAAGDLHLHRALTLPPTAADHLPQLTAAATVKMAVSPFTVTPVHGGDRGAALGAMQVLHAAATARDRKVLWCNTVDTDAREVRDADVADTITDVGTAHRRLADGVWTLLTDSVLVVDDAAAADPSVIADLAGHAQRAEASLILLDCGETTWPPRPSAALMKLLMKDLPWAVTLSVDDATPQRRSPQPDLDPVLDQAERLAEPLRTDQMREALTRRAQLRDQHQSSYRVQAELWRSTRRDAGRDQDLGREL